MKLWEVMERAGQLDHSERARLMEGCGPHVVETLLRIESGGTPPFYCAKCWTVFSPAGVIINPPGSRAPSGSSS